MIIVVAGNPVDGFSFVGPFDTDGDALVWADAHMNGDWWIVTLENPE
jgi:hypothetical protein